jgi:hypothetical protein
VKIGGKCTLTIIAAKSCKNLEILFVWPERAPQPPPCLPAGRQVGGVKGHNIKRNYLAGKPRRACPVLTGWAGSFTKNLVKGERKGH